MNFVDDIKSFATDTLKKRDFATNEEVTKTSMIIPFFTVLGYDTTNPAEFFPEFTADVGLKKGEKVDYAILNSGNPAILIECKCCGADLTQYDAQLFRYFGTTTAKFGILTNGIEYRFYTDLEEKNKMDMTPFMIFDLSNIKESLIPKLQKFCKDTYNSSDIFSTASNLKYSRLIQEWIEQQFDNPSEELQKLIVSSVYTSAKTKKVMEDFSPIIKQALNAFINERTTAMLQKAQAVLEPEQEAGEPQQVSKIVTTEEEMQGYYIVKAILADEIDVSRVTYRDAQSYFSVLLDDNNRKPICRLGLNATHKRVSIAYQGDFTKHDIGSLNDLYKYKSELVNAAKQYIKSNKEKH